MPALAQFRFASLAALLTASLLACGQAPSGPGAEALPDLSDIENAVFDPAALPRVSDAPTPVAPELPTGGATDGIGLQSLNAPRTFRLPALQGSVPKRVSAQALGARTSVVALRVLILTAGTSDPGLDAAKSLLDAEGVPYEVLDAVSTPLDTTKLIAADGSGRFQGVILTNNSLAYQDTGGTWQSALTEGEWSLLWQYEREYAARQLSLYTYPGTYPEDYGLRSDGDGVGESGAKLTAGGGEVFSSVRAGATLPIHNAWTYPARVEAAVGTSVTPLLADAAGHVLAARSDADGRERLALTFAHNPYLLHTQLLGDDLVRWLTRGLHLGEYRRFAQLDIDDWFLPTDEWDPMTRAIKTDAFRISAGDALAARAQQQALRAKYPLAKDFQFTMAFNGGGADLRAKASCGAGVPASYGDPLTSVTKCLQKDFDWVSHTKDHLYMDKINFADAYRQIAGNTLIGALLGLKLSPRSLVTGDMSGLGWYSPSETGAKTDFGLRASNPNFLKAATLSGVTFVASNRSVASHWDATCASCGVPHPLNASIFLIPRWPTNVYYYASTPAEIVSSYNAVYGPTGAAPHWDHDLSYDEIMDKETDLALSHVLGGTAFPHYMHQGNLREYAPMRSVAGDWLDLLFKKYSALSTAPLRTLRWDDLGVYLQRHTSHMKSGAQGAWDRASNTLTVSSARGGSVFVTGAAVGSVETSGNVTVGLVNFSAGQTRSFTLPK